MANITQRKGNKVRRLDTGLVFPRPGKDRAIDPARWFERALKVAKVADFRELEQVKCEIEEAAGLLQTIIDLSPTDGATARTHAIEELARRAGWLLDRCTTKLGGGGVNGDNWLDWCGGFPEQFDKLGRPGRGIGGREHGKANQSSRCLEGNPAGAARASAR